jgi:hypothetical protein
MGLGVRILHLAPKRFKAMRPCLRQRGTTLGPCRLSSRFLGTNATQVSWRLAVEEKNASVNALVYVVPDDAPRPVSRGPLDGVTVAVKDNICTKNMPTTCSSAMLRGNECLRNANTHLSPSSARKLT